MKTFEIRFLTDFDVLARKRTKLTKTTKCMPVCRYVGQLVCRSVGFPKFLPVCRSVSLSACLRMF